MRSISITALLAGTALSASAYAADIPAYEPPPVVAPVPQAFSWSGVYIGIHGGGVWQDQEDHDFGKCGPFTNIFGEGGEPEDFDDPGFEDCFVGKIEDGDSPNKFDFVPFFNLDDDYVAYIGGSDDNGDEWGFLGGGQVGINQQYGRLVLGLEGDFSGVFSNDDHESDVEFEYFHEAILCCLGNEAPFNLEKYQGTGTVRAEDSLEWLATFRGRVGGAFGNEGRLLLYATGGLALAGVEGSLSAEFDKDEDKDWCSDGCKFVDEESEDDDIQVGFVVGAGGEYAFNNNVSFGVQGLWHHFDEDEQSTNSVTFVGDDGRKFDVEHSYGVEDVFSITARLNWLFGPGTP